MERDPYNNVDIPWISQQEQIYERSDISESWAESPRQEQYQKIQPASPIPRMPKEEAQSLVRRLKQGLLISSIVGFGAMSWLVTFRQIAASLPQPSVPQLQQFGPSDSSGHFFDQGGNSFGAHHHRRYDFGQGQDQNSGPNQNQNSGPGQGQSSGPISGSHVS